MVDPSSGARLAVYFTPPCDHPLTRAAAAWLGRDAFDAADTAGRGAGDGISASAHAAWVADPRRYGFHATIKAPFRLCAPFRPEDVEQALAFFCAATPAFDIRLRVGQLGRFFALLPDSEADAARLRIVASQALMFFDRYRAPSTEAELARRRRAGLNAEQDGNLVQWGYPYVLSDFRFHMSLTGAVPEPQQEQVATLLTQHFGPVLEQSVRFAHLALFEQPRSGADFVVRRLTEFGTPLPASANPGTLVAVVGPSGAGKDTLLADAQKVFATNRDICFLRRVVTRRATPDAEDHDSLSEAAFEDYCRRGGFALSWQAHGLRYGLPSQVAAMLAAGRVVVANVSRGSVAEAQARFENVLVLNVTAAPDVLTARLRQRGRESEAQIAARVARDIQVAPTGGRVVTIDNSGDLDTAVTTFRNALQDVLPRAGHRPESGVPHRAALSP